MNKFHFELVSPEARLMAEDVTLVTIPGAEGDFGVLDGHAPLVSAIRPGIVSIHRNDMKDAPVRIFIGGGFADVGLHHCTILAEDTMPAEQLDAAALDAEIANLNARLAGTSDEYEQHKLYRQLEKAQAKRLAAA